MHNLFKTQIKLILKKERKYFGGTPCRVESMKERKQMFTGHCRVSAPYRAIYYIIRLDQHVNSMK